MYVVLRKLSIVNYEGKLMHELALMLVFRQYVISYIVVGRAVLQNRKYNRNDTESTTPRVFFQKRVLLDRIHLKIKLVHIASFALYETNVCV